MSHTRSNPCLPSRDHTQPTIGTGSTRPAIRPRLTIAEMLQSGEVYVPAPSFTNPGWIPSSPVGLHCMTAGQLTTIGDGAMVCSAYLTTPRALAVLEHAGLSIPARIHRFDTPDSMVSLLAHLHAGGASLALQHAMPQDEVPPEAYWMDPDVLRRLNNKAHLAEFVPYHAMPPRIIVDRRDWSIDHPALRELPVVVKVASDQSSGGGFDVRICRTREHVQEAVELFSTGEPVVVEEYLSMVPNLCVQFAVCSPDEITYLGATEQIIDEGGQYKGNWLDARVTYPDEVESLGRHIVSAAARLGYRGIAGVDMGRSEDGRWIVFDLNFRVNGSTAALLLQRDIDQILGRSIIRNKRLDYAGPFEEMATLVDRYVRQRCILPLYVFDSADYPEPNLPLRISVLMLGQSRDEVDVIETELAHAGFG